MAKLPVCQVVVCLDDQVVMQILAEDILDSTERLHGQCMVAIPHREAEEVAVEITLLEEGLMKRRRSRSRSCRTTFSSIFSTVLFLELPMRKRKCRLNPSILSFLSLRRFLKFAGAERMSRATRWVGEAGQKLASRPKTDGIF